MADGDQHPLFVRALDRVPEVRETDPRPPVPLARLFPQEPEPLPPDSPQVPALPGLDRAPPTSTLDRPNETLRGAWHCRYAGCTFDTRFSIKLRLYIRE
ncbi:hypothetical protein CCGE531_28775 (plasmid) [Rhizobium sp. CCGE531]|nr:hypothetical protein CCGE531_28775 [Rhizobium sp. CCGE531]AYG76427.1 hypothetical protein CCGE532_28250 [Rhizobium sp. CCGE532]